MASNLSRHTHQTILSFHCWNKESITGVFIDGLRILIVYLNDLKGLSKIILLWLYVWKWNPLSMKNYFLFVSVGSIAKLGSTKLWKSENANSRFWNALRWGKTKAKSKFLFCSLNFRFNRKLSTKLQIFPTRFSPHKNKSRVSVHFYSFWLILFFRCCIDCDRPIDDHVLRKVTLVTHTHFSAIALLALFNQSNYLSIHSSSSFYIC